MEMRMATMKNYKTEQLCRQLIYLSKHLTGQKLMIVISPFYVFCIQVVCFFKLGICRRNPVCSRWESWRVIFLFQSAVFCRDACHHTSSL